MGGKRGFLNFSKPPDLLGFSGLWGGATWAVKMGSFGKKRIIAGDRRRHPCSPIDLEQSPRARFFGLIWLNLP
jgi:hypothetical protein